jgi:hypothetical protein
VSPHAGLGVEGGGVGVGKREGPVAPASLRYAGLPFVIVVEVILQKKDRKFGKIHHVKSLIRTTCQQTIKEMQSKYFYQNVLI